MPKLLTFHYNNRDRMFTFPFRNEEAEREFAKSPLLPANQSYPIDRLGRPIDAGIVPPFAYLDFHHAMAERGDRPPDVLLNSNRSLIISNAFREVCLSVNPNSIETFEIELRDFVHKTPVEGRWWFVNFLETLDTIDEHRSNRNWATRDLCGATHRADRPAPMLYATEEGAGRAGLWSGVPVFPAAHLGKNKGLNVPALRAYRDPPANLGSMWDFYCCDQLAQAAQAAGLDFFDQKFDIDSDAEICAVGAPRVVWETTERLSKFHYVPLFNVVSLAPLLKGTLSTEAIIGPEEDRPVIFNVSQTGQLPDIVQMRQHGFFVSPRVKSAILDLEPEAGDFYKLRFATGTRENPGTLVDLFCFRPRNKRDAIVYEASPGFDFAKAYMNEKGDIFVDADLVEGFQIWTPDKLRFGISSVGYGDLFLSEVAYRHLSEAVDGNLSFFRKVELVKIDYNK